MSDFIQTRDNISLRDTLTVTLPAHMWIQLGGWLEAYIAQIPNRSVTPTGPAMLLETILDLMEEHNPAVSTMTSLNLSVSHWLMIAGWDSWIPEACEGMRVVVTDVLRQLVTPLALNELEAKAQQAADERHAFMHRMFTGENPPSPDILLGDPDGV